MQKFLLRAVPVLAITLRCAVAPGAEPEAGELAKSSPRAFDAKLSALRLHSDGNRLLGPQGNEVRLRGVNIASLEWSDQGEHVLEAFAQATRVWNANIVRLPLAQDRWFGKTSGQHDDGLAYRERVDKLVDAAADGRVYIDLDLHWSDCGKWATNGGRLAQHPMPDENSVLFWRDLATRYRNHPMVIFGLYNEPHDVTWEIWHDGGTVTEKASRRAQDQTPVVYASVGMQRLYQTVRATGAENLVTVSGLDWGYDLRGVLQGHAIQGTNLVYETHPYPFKHDWDKCFGDVSKSFPVLMGEWGGAAKDLDYGRNLMDYAREHRLNWTAWCFHPSCGPPLLKNWTFEPNAFGQFVKETLTGKVAQAEKQRE